MRDNYRQTAKAQTRRPQNSAVAECFVCPKLVTVFNLDGSPKEVKSSSGRIYSALNYD